jgi:hypothetical protein
MADAPASPNMRIVEMSYMVPNPTAQVLVRQVRDGSPVGGTPSFVRGRLNEQRGDEAGCDQQATHDHGRDQEQLSRVFHASSWGPVRARVVHLVGRSAVDQRHDGDACLEAT